MKHNRVIVKMLAFLTIVLLGTTTPAHAEPEAPAANSGVTGQIVDGGTAQPWLYGGEVAVIEVNGGVLGSTNLSNDGSFTVTYGTDPLSLCTGSCTTPTDFAEIYVLINFTCNLNTSDGERTATPLSSDDTTCPINDTLAGGGEPLTGLPNNINLQGVDTGTGVQDLGDIDTNRGPTAVSLNTFSANGQPTNWLPTAAALMLVSLMGVALIKRRHN